MWRRNRHVSPKLSAIIVASVLPTLLVSLLFYVLLGHRRDYLGHYAAGYGGTLCASAIVFAAIPIRSFNRIAYSIAWIGGDTRSLPRAVASRLYARFAAGVAIE